MSPVSALRWRIRPVLPALVCIGLLLGLVTLVAQSQEKAGVRPNHSAELTKDIQRATQLLNEGKMKEFIEEYVPVDELRQIRQQTTVTRAAADPRFTKEYLKRLSDMLALCEKAKPELANSDGLATFKVVLMPAKKAPAATPAPKPVALKAEPLDGFGKDLNKALAAANSQLGSKTWDKFILGFYPLSEAQRLKSSGQLADQVFVIQENPGMVEAMTKDLQALQKLKPTFTDNGATAEYKLPPANAGESARVVRFQLVDGNWRLFDSVSPVRKQIDELANKSAGDEPEPLVIRWERLGSRWRLATMEFTAE